MPTIRQWDITVGDGTNTEGFMVDEISYGDAQTLGPRVLGMGDVSEAEFPPEIQVVHTQKGGLGGIGGKDMEDYRKKLQYADGLKVDASGENIVQSARLIQATALASGGTASTKGAQGFGWTGTNLWHFVDVVSGADRAEGFTWNFTNRNWVSRWTDNESVFYPGGVLFAANIYFPRWGIADNTSAFAYEYNTIASTAAPTTATITPNDLYFMAVSADQRMWGAYRPTAGQRHYIYSSLDPTNSGSWAGPTEVGDSSADITNLLPWGDGVLIFKQDGIYTLDIRGDVINLDRGNIRGRFHTDNFRAAVSMPNGHVLAAWGDAGMIDIDPDGVMREVGFPLVAPDIGTLDGRVIALAADSDRVYAIVEDTTTLGYLLAAEWREVNGKADYRWHVLDDVVLLNSTAIHRYRVRLFPWGFVSGSDTYRRLWLSRHGAAGGTRAEFLPKVNDRDDAFNNDNDGRYDTVDIDFNHPSMPKTFDDLVCRTANLGTGGTDHNITVSYSLDGGSFTAHATNLTTSPQTLAFPSGTTGRRMRLRFDLNRGSTTTTSPELLEFTLRGELRPAAAKMLAVTIRLRDGLKNREGGHEERIGIKLSRLTTWNGQAAPVTVTSQFQTAGNTSVSIPGRMLATKVRQGKKRRSDMKVRMLFLEV